MKAISPLVDLIHIGDYKTGTSWLQQHVFSENSNIYYVDSYNHPKVIHLMHQLVDQRDIDFDADSLRRKFSYAFSEIDFEKKKIVISREALSGIYPTGDNAKRIAERLHAVFGNTKVLIVVREQFSMLKTIYSQYIKIGGTLSFKEFIYDPIVSPGLIEKLKYHKIIDVYYELFEQNNIFVGLFEDFKEDNKLFATRISHFIDCTYDLSLVENCRVVNPSLRQWGLEFQRFTNRFLRNDFNPRKPIFPIDRFAALFLTDERKKILLDSTRNRLVYSVPGRDEALVLRHAISFGLVVRLSRICEKIQIGPKLAIPTQILEDLKDEFVESNNILREKYKLPVDKFGWTI